MTWLNRGGLATNREVLADVETHPGTTIREIELRLEMDEKTVRRHLRVLQVELKISTFRFGNRLLIYHRSPQIPTLEHQEAHAALSRVELRNAFQAVVEEGTTTTRVAERLATDPKHAYRALDTLLCQGLVERIDRTLWRRSARFPVDSLLQQPPD